MEAVVVEAREDELGLTKLDLDVIFEADSARAERALSALLVRSTAHGRASLGQM